MPPQMMGVGGIEVNEEVTPVPTETPSGCQCDAQVDRRSESLWLFLVWMVIALGLKRAHLKSDEARAEA